MKKLLLITLMIAILTCAFVLVVNAEENASKIPEWTEITEVAGMPDKSKFGEDGTIGATSRVLMSDGITYPAYYICKNSTSLGFDYNDLSTKTGKSYSAINVVRLEVPKGVTSSPQSALKTASGYTSLKTVSFPEGFTTLNGYTFYGSSTAPSALVNVSLPSTLTKVGQKEFLDCIALEELIIPDGVESIPTDFARNATSLKKVVLPASLKTISATAFRYAGLEGSLVIPEGCHTIGQYAFANTNLTSVTLPSTLGTTVGETVGTVDKSIFYACRSITDVYSYSPVIGAQMFNQCDNLTNVVLKNTVSIGAQAFSNDNENYQNKTTKIVGLVLPEGLKSIGNSAFVRCNITEIVLPSTLETIGESVFAGCLSLEKVVVLGPATGKSMFSSCSSVTELVLTDKFVTFGSNCLDYTSSTSFTTYYTGTDYERVKTLCKASTRFSQAGVSTYEEYQGENYTRPKTYMLVYDCNVCDVGFGGVHTAAADDGNCNTAVMCRICKEYECRAALEHISGERLSYTDIMKVGEYYLGCTNPGCTVGETTVAKALFENLGYSAEIGGSGIVREFLVNEDALNDYKRLIDPDFKYGIVVALANNTPLSIGEDGKITASGSAVVANFTNSQINKLQMKIANIPAESFDTVIVNTVYAYTNNEIYYANLVGMDKTAVGKSYNDLNTEE